MRAVALLLASGAFASAADATFSTDVRVVNVVATVRDARGKIIPDLNAQDFLLEENGQPQTIRWFVRESGLPLTLGLLLDTSLSQRRVLGREKSASSDFFKRVLGNQQNEAFLLHFDRDVELLQDVTSSRESLQAGLRSLDAPEPKQGRWVVAGSPGRGRFGGTALYDAVFLASNEIMRAQKKDRRKALIVLSDGVDIGSRVKLTDAIVAAQRAETLVYSVLFVDQSFYGDASTDWRHLPDGRQVLRQLSAETGGGFFEVSDQQPVDVIYRHIEDELRNQYSIGYVPDPAPAGPRFHAIQLKTRDSHFTVQARAGYYAQ